MKMKNFKFKSTFFAAVVLTLNSLCSCTGEFSEWNVNPHEASEEMMNRDNLLTGSFFTQMEKNVFIVGEGKGGAYQVTEVLAGDIFSGYMGNTGTYSYATYHNSHYALYKGWYNTAFNEAYKDVMQPWYSIKQVAEEKLPSTYALATIVKVFGMSRITDMYGPIPYTEFGGSLKANYDSQKKIYDTFFEELSQSITALTSIYNGDRSAKTLSDYDFVYQGNLKKWIIFANTLRLRLAMRLAYVDASKAQTEAEAAVAHELGVMTTTSESAYLHQGAKLNFKNPLWEISESFGDVRMGATMDSYLNGYEDPRLPIYFRKANDDNFRGVRCGISISNKSVYAKGPFSGLNAEINDDMLWIDVAEAYFLRAEGALRGWNMGAGTVQEFYETGISKSFESRGAVGAESYMADNTKVPVDYTDPVNTGNSVTAKGTLTIQWKDAASFEEKLERIMTQKWIALYPDGQEAWSEFRRTGYPKIFTVAMNKSNGEVDTNTQICRLKYPTTEYENNAENVSEAVSLLSGADTGGTKLWWDAK
jgi:hypothetical protein